LGPVQRNSCIFAKRTQVRTVRSSAESVIKIGLKSVFGGSEARSTVGKTNPNKAILARFIWLNPTVESQTRSNPVKPGQTRSNPVKPGQTRSNPVKPNQGKSNQFNQWLAGFREHLKFFQKALAFYFASDSLRAPRRP
jgi:hypothetical protein